MKSKGNKLKIKLIKFNIPIVFNKWVKTVLLLEGFSSTGSWLLSSTTL